ncbi:SAM-dependent methyltransferase [Neochlamydia sp. AcF95]|uniref:class I SAM-dependent methyltransferase n=1 Tax=Neochlamydia sp. AcF95 TaxID=2795734 RepID=UPI001BC9F440|nr:SAM-dependent methyltransferase [Neochlamydia sp. AcF95]MBS4170641.1 Uncharacterized protein [Neochlamydia sp. AcF95]
MQLDKINFLIQELLQENSFLQAILSSPRDKISSQKITIRPVSIKNNWRLQFSHQQNQKVIHKNYSVEEGTEKILEALKHYKQALFCTASKDYQILISKKGEATVLFKPASKKATPLPTHNRSKNYLLKENEPILFLQELGVISNLGKVLPGKRDKFCQINRFLEMVQDIVPYFAKDKTLQIVDFGCGKAYLTFALYYYLHFQLKYKVQITGLDLKADVVVQCQNLAHKLGFTHLRFIQGDINAYTANESIDLMVSLHACDTATDAALEKAVRWQAQVIMVVPCCQHELYKQVQCESLEPLLSHGILKERFSALVTEAARAKLLEILGYKTQVIEFIDMEHTPKNLLIRAIRQSNSKAHYAELLEQYYQFKNTLEIKPFLEKCFIQDLMS